MHSLVSHNNVLACLKSDDSTCCKSPRSVSRTMSPCRPAQALQKSYMPPVPPPPKFSHFPSGFLASLFKLPFYPRPLEQLFFDCLSCRSLFFLLCPNVVGFFVSLGLLLCPAPCGVFRSALHTVILVTFLSCVYALRLILTKQIEFEFRTAMK